MKAILLGTTAGLPTPAPGGTGTYAVLVAAGSDLLLFDCGRRATMNIARAGCRPGDVQHLFLTHLHYDHTVDVPEFVLSTWAAGRRGGLCVFGPRGTAHFMNALFGPDGAYAADIAARCGPGPGPIAPPELHVTELYDPGEVCGTVEWAVRCAFVRHTPRYIEAIAYRIDAGDRSVVVSGDTTPVEEMVDLAAGATVLIHEGAWLQEDLDRSGLAEAHTSAEAAADIAARAGVSHLVINHITKRTTPEKLIRAEQVIRDRFAGTVTFGRDLLAIEA